LRDKTKTLQTKWTNEKEALTDIGKMKKELETLRLEADAAEASADLSRAAEIRYGSVPELEKRLEERVTKLRKFQRTRRLLREEVTEEDIASVVSRWTGIPVARMLEA